MLRGLLGRCFSDWLIWWCWEIHLVLSRDGNPTGSQICYQLLILVNEWPVIEGSFDVSKTYRGLPQFISTFTLPGIWKGHKMLKKRGIFSIWSRILVIPLRVKNVVSFGLSEMQGKFGKCFVCVTDLGVVLQYLSLILMEPLTMGTYISPFLSKKTM